ncbi:hypothetical protein KL86DES1_10965 [uncultured Desulfovibrio sp.]|uniref:Uncharacterized protein n=1 Tax=uncultured Desulfovibrio sp. TaxID=167968 RepID=A0A212L185_9BACT|nr:hypothetical protein KL86DES1_10965 [uncultured Desulfovibrio sp.]VZH32837.1 conserved protein of unknown function [Desulfovibrio sp. 86]
MTPRPLADYCWPCNPIRLSRRDSCCWQAGIWPAWWARLWRPDPTARPWCCVRCGTGEKLCGGRVKNFVGEGPDLDQITFEIFTFQRYHSAENAIFGRIHATLWRAALSCSVRAFNFFQKPNALKRVSSPTPPPPKTLIVFGYSTESF